MTLPQELHGMVMITVHPDHVALPILSSVDVIFAIGEAPEKTMREFSQALGQRPPSIPPTGLKPGEAIAWFRRTGSAPFWLRSIPPKSERRRHLRKYIEGEVPEEEHFYFRGPEGKLNLRAQNLQLFLQIAEGVDDETWMYHLRRGEYSDWFLRVIKDEDLASQARRVEAMPDVSPGESRELIKATIEKRYTGSA
jgi:hypothetical protein